MSRSTLVDTTQHALGSLWARAELHATLNTHLLEHLPSPLAEHVILACIDDDTVALMTDSAQWASELRYRSAEILAIVKKHYGGDLRRCRIKVRPHLFTAQANDDA